MNTKNIISIKSFFIKYPDFDLNYYKKYNPEIKNLKLIDILNHFYVIGYHKNLIYSKESYENILNNDTLNNDILNNDTLNNDTLNKHTLNNHTLNNDTLNNDTLNNDTLNNHTLNNDTLNNHTLNNHTLNNKIFISHIFVHFFKIGGGECYISNFNKYNKNIFKEILFINKNYNNNTLFDYNSNIILYNTYEELNEYLIKYNFDIIIDHQLYWFNSDITNTVFKNIEYNKIVRLTHGVPIHFKNINNLNYYYSIELYNEVKSDNSWNNHIKLYNNIGVKIKDNILKNLNTNNINIAIVGRINNEKIPNDFIKLLLEFCKIYKTYKFNFYGELDEIYSKYFLLNINKNTYNIIYHGIVNPNNIDIIYTNNDILIHPSKYEAGATVILEAMSYGLPIISRNVGGIPNASNNNSDKYNNFLCNTEKEMFEKILTINNDNYNLISKNNILKISIENNIEIQFNKLFSDLKLIYYIENNNLNIPNILHYIYGLKKQTSEFPFVYYLSILSNVIINKPKVIFFHYQYLPYGKWWDEATKYLKLNYINVSNIYWGSKKIIKYAHKADKIRLDILLKYGGVYMDIDTITYKPYFDLLNYNFVIGIQEDNYNNSNEKLLCNAILFSNKNNIFLKKWINEYEKYFDPNGWCEASVHLPYKIYNDLNENDKQNIKIMKKESFYYPSYDKTDNIFEKNEDIHNDLITLHLWNTYSEKYYSNINNFDWMNSNNSLYSKLIRNLYNKITIK
jgi:glycosyltransferase involved in cell wall biosynthesis